MNVALLCFDSEGFGPISDKRILDFTICFENVVLLSIPKLLLLLVGREQPEFEVRDKTAYTPYFYRNCILY
jgi:hypothetical protein